MNKPDITGILQREGVNLRPKGRDLWARCPLHQDASPSFKVDPERQTFHCFGCGAGGDVISFVQQYRKIQFREALAYLGISGSEPHRPDPREIKKRTLIKGFKARCNLHSVELARDLRALRGIVAGIKTHGDMMLRAWAYHEIPAIEYKLDLLQYGDDETKYLLLKEAMTNGATV